MDPNRPMNNQYDAENYRLHQQAAWAAQQNARSNSQQPAPNARQSYASNAFSQPAAIDASSINIPYSTLLKPAPAHTTGIQREMAAYKVS